MKRKNSFLIISFVIFTFLLSCRKEEPPVPSPDWKIAESPDYSVNMTAVVEVPATQMLMTVTGDKDRLAAFVGDECRGVGTRVKGEVYFVLIRGKADESKNVKFKYYNADWQKMYETDSFLPFEPDVVFGTIDVPEILNLQKVAN